MPKVSPSDVSKAIAETDITNVYETARNIARERLLLMLHARNAARVKRINLIQIEANQLVPGMRVFRFGEQDGQFKLDEVLKDRLDSLGCKGVHFKTDREKNVCYARCSPVWVALPSAK